MKFKNFLKKLIYREIIYRYIECFKESIYREYFKEYFKQAIYMYLGALFGLILCAPKKIS